MVQTLKANRWGNGITASTSVRGDGSSTRRSLHQQEAWVPVLKFRKYFGVGRRRDRDEATSW